MTLRDPISDATTQVQLWYLRERNKYGMSEYGTDIDYKSRLQKGRVLGQGSFGKVEKAQFVHSMNKTFCVKSVYAPVSIFPESKWRIRMPNDVEIPYAMRNIQFLSGILDIQVQNPFYFEVLQEIKDDSGRILKYESYKNLDHSPYSTHIHPNLEYDLTEGKEGPYDKNGTCRLFYRAPTIIEKEHQKNTTQFLQSLDKNNPVQNQWKLYAHFTITMDKCDLDLRRYVDLKRKNGLLINNNSKIKILNAITEQMIEMFEKVGVVYADMKLDNVACRISESNEKMTFHLVDFGSFYRIGQWCSETFRLPIALNSPDFEHSARKKNWNPVAKIEHGIWSLYVLFHELHSTTKLLHNGKGEESKELITMMSENLKQSDDKSEGLPASLKKFLSEGFKADSFGSALRKFLNTVILPILSNSAHHHSQEQNQASSKEEGEVSVDNSVPMQQSKETRPRQLDVSVRDKLLSKLNGMNYEITNKILDPFSMTTKTPIYRLATEFCIEYLQAIHQENKENEVSINIKAYMNWPTEKLKGEVEKKWQEFVDTVKEAILEIEAQKRDQFSKDDIMAQVCMSFHSYHTMYRAYQDYTKREIKSQQDQKQWIRKKRMRQEEGKRAQQTEQLETWYNNDKTDP